MMERFFVYLLAFCVFASFSFYLGKLYGQSICIECKCPETKPVVCPEQSMYIHKGECIKRVEIYKAEIKSLRTQLKKKEKTPCPDKVCKITNVVEFCNKSVCAKKK